MENELTKTLIAPITGSIRDNPVLKQAAQRIVNGGLVVFPTETVYGLGGNALDGDAARRIYLAKGRPSDNPLIIHLAQAADADAYCETTPLFYRLAKLFSPGPLTMIMKRRATIPDTVTGGMNTVAVRIPSDPVAHELIRLSGVPIAAPSANLSGHPSPTTAQHVIRDLNGRVDMILAGDDSAIGLESTVIKLEGEDIILLRPGAVTYEMLVHALGKAHVHVDRIVTEQVTGDFKPLSPGMKYKHYAPQAQVILLDGTPEAVLACMQEKMSEPHCGILCYDEEYPQLKGAYTLRFGSRRDAADQAKRLFAQLRAFDDMPVDTVYGPVPDKSGIGLAVYNRLVKASGFCIQKTETVYTGASKKVQDAANKKDRSDQKDLTELTEKARKQMAVIQPRTLSGFMELLPKNQMQMERMMQALRETYALYGFTPLDTPVIEAAEILLAKSGGETEKQIYRFTRGENDLALRFDLTVPLAKYVAMHYGELTFPFRRYQIGKVYRGERTQRGRFREFYQADIDIIGDGKLDIINEAEIPSIIYRAFTSLGLSRFCIRMNNRKVLNGFFAILGLTEKSGEVMRVIDKWDKVGKDKIKQMLMDDCQLSVETAERILAFLSHNGDWNGILSVLDQMAGQNEMFDTGAAELKTVLGYMAQFGVPETAYTVDLTIARGLDYYTGTVYETQMLDHPEIGSICSGGRYDNLAEYYTEKPLPGVGISIGLTRLFYVLSEQGYVSERCVTSPADVLIIPMTEELSDAISLATLFRNSGIRTQLYTEKKKFKAKISYADKLNIPYVVFLGEDEIQAGNVTLKTLASGEQVTVSAAAAAEIVAAGMQAARDAAVIEDGKK